MAFVDFEKENSISQKCCGNCINLTSHKYIETYEKIIHNFRPHSGRRLLAPREAKETIESWQCEICGYYGNFNNNIEYIARKRKI